MINFVDVTVLLKTGSCNNLGQVIQRLSEQYSHLLLLALYFLIFIHFWIFVQNAFLFFVSFLLNLVLGSPTYANQTQPCGICPGLRCGHPLAQFYLVYVKNCVASPLTAGYMGSFITKISIYTRKWFGFFTKPCTHMLIPEPSTIRTEGEGCACAVGIIRFVKRYGEGYLGR